MAMSSRVLTLIALATVFTVLTACPSGAAAPQQAATSTSAQQVPAKATIRENMVNVGIIWDPITFDPHAATSSETGIINNMYEPLVFTNREKTDLVPWLAESWKAADGGRRYTFKIRQNVKFADGAVLDAEAVKANFDRILRLKKGPYWVLEGLQGVRVVDPMTVEFTLKPGGPPFLQALLLVRMISPKALKQQAGSDDAQSWLTSNVAGTGPYTLERFDRGDRVVLRYFPEYWQGWKDGQFTRANLLIIPESTTQALMIDRGDIDLAYKVPKDYLAVAATKIGLSVVEAPGNNLLSIRLNAQAGPTKDVRVRQALAYAFDYEGYLKAMAGTYAALRSPVPPQYIGAFQPSFPYRLDVNKARDLLKDAGYSARQKMKITIDILSGFPDQQAAAELLKAGAEQTGYAEVNIRLNEWAAMFKSLVEWGSKRDPNNVRNGFALWTGARIPDPYAYLWYLFHSKAQGGSGRNLIYYENSTVDQLIDKASVATSPQERTAAYKKAIQMVVDESTDIIVGVQTSIYVVRKSLDNYFVDPNWFPSVQLYPLRRGQ